MKNFDKPPAADRMDLSALTLLVEILDAGNLSLAARKLKDVNPISRGNAARGPHPVVHHLAVNADFVGNMVDAPKGINNIAGGRLVHGRGSYLSF